MLGRPRMRSGSPTLGRRKATPCGTVRSRGIPRHGERGRPGSKETSTGSATSLAVCITQGTDWWRIGRQGGPVERAGSDERVVRFRGESVRVMLQRWRVSMVKAGGRV